MRRKTRMIPYCNVFISEYNDFGKVNMIFDFSNYPLSGIYYSGSERKLGILVDGFPYMLKFQIIDPYKRRNNHISEYLGSHVFELFGLQAQQTYLGTYQGRNVVACKDFVSNGFQFVPFNDVGESTIEADWEKYQYSYEDILALLRHNRKRTDVQETVSTFFEIYILDALLGNFDRHGANWGFLKKDNRYFLAPVFDNGSCLFPQVVHEDEMQLILSDETEIERRICDFPTSQIKLRGQKSSYYEVISSLQFEECNKSLLKIAPRVDFRKIDVLIDSVPISAIHKEFYRTMIRERYNRILKPSFDHLKSRMK